MFNIGFYRWYIINWSVFEIPCILKVLIQNKENDVTSKNNLNDLKFSYVVVVGMSETNTQTKLEPILKIFRNLENFEILEFINISSYRFINSLIFNLENIISKL